ncbi:hypothetical protein D8674_030464 [Pyrus ussuriensis x Pyrus communis]|uniref:Uncharacterized protein n=1 Tax=Pyrus ussuriensis x Pyrus communis TaxID=2448454 RepID=A0A5N5F8N1_9ROSA|nr:hypothetical protein D8674_030464 [Pyrus ussuriensis x Pyrus communis]
MSAKSKYKINQQPLFPFIQINNSISSVSENYPLGELEACRELLNKDWNCELGHIYDEMHFVVEELANLNSLGLVYFAQTPTSCHLLVSDVAKIFIPCDVLL